LDRTGQTLLGKYELTRVLGKGGMGEVWEGEHTLTGRKVAVKILAENYLANRKVVARFGREARAASSVHHAGIVEILDQDKTDDGVPFLVMEFLEGESVGERIRKLGKLTQDEALAIMLPLLDALDCAHQAGVVHRDLKPDNVFILPGPRGEERIKILDFGISQKADEIEHGLTQEGSVLGTPHYMSPEQARGEAGIDARVDVYAAGVMFYECVVGDVPFDAGNYNALLQIILGTPPPSPKSRGADISNAVEQVLLAAMDKKRDRRPPSARVFHDLLLEAGMQEDDSILDIATWTFSTPSEPPPPLDFGPDESTGLTSVPAQFSAPPGHHGGVPGPYGATPPAPSFDDDFDSPASGSSNGLFGAAPGRATPPAARAPARPKQPPPPSAFADDGLEADLFASAPAPMRSMKPENTQKPLVVPPPNRGPTTGPFGAAPPPAFDAGPGPRGAFDAPMPAGRGNPFEAPRTQMEAPQRAAAAPAPSFQRPMIDPVPRMGSGRPGMGERPRVNFTTQLERGDSPTVGRTILNWLAVIVMIALLGYLVRVIADRPDPRKRKKQDTEQTQQGGEGAAGEAAGQPADPAANAGE
jgi:serine/threonine protein kinase